MSFADESEKQNRMSFLDVKIFSEDKTFTASAYHKPTFCGVYIHFDSFLPSNYTFGTVYTITYRCFRICLSWNKLHTELFCLKEIFLRNGYPENFINALKSLWITHM